MLGNAKRRRLPELFLCIFFAIFVSTVYWLRPFQSSEPSHRISQPVAPKEDLYKSQPITPPENSFKTDPVSPDKENPKQDSPKQDTPKPPSTAPKKDSSKSQPFTPKKDPPKSKLHSIDHPIKQFHKAATEKFEKLLASQSKSLPDAIKEYERRYKRSPPPGFNQWYEFAVEQKSVIIDEFDMISEAIEPFWSVEPSILRTLVDKSLDGRAMQYLVLESGNFTPSHENWMGARISDTLSKYPLRIPDFKIPMNPLDEPRILLSENPSVDEVEWTDASQHPAYTKIMGPCKNKKAKAKHTAAIDTLGFSYVNDMSTMQDVCLHPEYKSEHGFMTAPCSLLWTDSVLPILSQAGLSTFSDILYPSMWYWDHEMRNLDDFDMDWKQKRNKLYWVGKSTGGWERSLERGESRYESHRYKFINITKQIDPASFDFLSRDKVGDEWIKYSSEEVLSQLYETKLVEVIQCDHDVCEENKKKYQVGSRDDGKVAFQHRFLMDLDGNSFSGRFYNLLASNSCTLKSTIFREWHDERLVAWVHYIPVSVGMQEMPETMRYLALTTEGDEIAQKVAQAGKEWNHKMLRREDAAVYLYRLFLEYARVMSDDRESTTT